MERQDGWQPRRDESVSNVRQGPWRRGQASSYNFPVPQTPTSPVRDVPDASSQPTPTAAADADLKQEVEKISSAYIESFNKQDAAGIAALYATGGVLVTPRGPHADIAEFYQGVFKAGLDHDEGTIDQVWPLGSDAALALGEYRITGRNQSESTS